MPRLPSPRSLPFLAALALSSLGSATTTRAQDAASSLSSILAEDVQLKLHTDQCKFTEGPAANDAGVVYFTDQPNDRILRVRDDGSVETFLQPAGRSNGMFFDPKDRLITCADGKNEIWQIGEDGSHEVLFSAEDAERLNGPNDLWISPQGAIYFTDPYYQRPWWDHKQPPREVRGLYRFDREKRSIELIDDDFRQPNGIVGDTQRKILYVADIEAKKIYAYPLKDDGSLGERRLFCSEPSDGMTVDDRGNVYMTNSEGVVVYSPEGKKLGAIETGERWTANVCFGGPDHSTLYITASDSLYSIDTKVRGLR